MPATDLQPIRGAVFLSYASQDAEAACHICDALRAAGVEVWFDRSELRGGDTWDQKIRKQIKECVLFLPVVSAATQARREGYFRLEWKLADDRTHLMARGTPFLVPVCIDETKDWDALVPDSFMNVQWTRLPGGETPEKFAERVVQLLAGGTTPPMPTKAPWSDQRGRSAAPMVAVIPVLEKKFPRWPLALGALAVVSAGIFFVMRAKPPPSAAASAVTSAPAPPTARDWPRDPELKRAIALIDGLEATLEDFRLADEISTHAVDKAPADPETVTVRARVHAAFLTRNFDFSLERAAAAKRFGERAVQLAPDNPQALYALAVFLHDRAKDYAQAESLARHACALAPDEPRFWRQVARSAAQLRPAEGLALGEDLVRRFPRDVLVHYELSILYRDQRQWEKFERENDATIALFPLANAVNWKARAAGLLHGDFAEMRRWLDQVPARVRAEERTVTSSISYAMLGGDYAFGLKSLQGFAEPWFFDQANYAGPAALPQAMLLGLQGKSGLARAQYELALAELLRRRQTNPSDQTSRRAETWVRLGLGQLDEARAQYRTNLEAQARPHRVFAMTGWLFDFIPLGLLLGDRDTAVQLVREAASVPEGRKTIRHRMSVDARMALFRADPEIVALLAEPKTETGAITPKPDEKSVAVLPFANLSGDATQEYFSDGLTEEILSALSNERDLRVPGRTSAFSFKGKTLTTPEIARALNVAQVVEGSVRKSGNQVRIIVTLTRAADGFSEPLGTFTEKFDDIFALQEKVARVVVEKLTKRTATASNVAAPTQNLAAYDLYLRARAAQTGGLDLASRREAVRLYEEALRLDPDYALASARLAQMLHRNRLNGSDRSEKNAARARDAALTAVRRDPNLTEAHLALAQVRQSIDYDFVAAQRELDEAERLRPNDPEAPAVRLELEFAQGHWGDALVALATRAAELDPRNVFTLHRVGLILREMGLFAEADRRFAQAWALSLETALPLRARASNYLAWTGDLPGALAMLETIPKKLRDEIYWDLAELQAMGGRFPAAMADYEQARTRVASGLATISGPGRLQILATFRLGQLEARLGRGPRAAELYTEALAASRQFAKDFPDSPEAPQSRAIIHALRGEKSEARAAMAEATQVAARTHAASAIAAARRTNAETLVLLGETAVAIAELRALHEQGYGFGYLLRLQLEWEPLRGDAKFQQLMKEAEARADAQPRPKK